MDIKKMALVIGGALLAMMAWVTIKVYFIHDPDNFFEVDARPHMVAWMMDNCKAYECANTQGGTPWSGVVEIDEGFIYELVTRRTPPEIYLLVPRDNPREKRLVTIEPDPEGGLRISEGAPGEPPRAAQKKAAREPSLMKQWKYGLGVLALAVIAGIWISRRRSGDERPIKEILRERNASPAMDAAGIMARAEAKGGTPRGTTGTASPPGKDPLDAAGQQLQRLLQTDKPRAAELGREHVCALVKAGRREDAVKAFEQCTAIDPAFRLAAAEQVLPLAKAALEAGNVPTAISALRGFDKKYPGHALIPDVYVFSAKLMAEKMGQVETARKILQHIVERFPGHHLAQEARRTLKDLEQRSPA